MWLPAAAGCAEAVGVRVFRRRATDP